MSRCSRPTQRTDKLTLTAALVKHSNHFFELLENKDFPLNKSETALTIEGPLPFSPSNYLPVAVVGWALSCQAHRRCKNGLRAFAVRLISIRVAPGGEGQPPARGRGPLGNYRLIPTGTSERKMKSRVMGSDFGGL